MANEVTFIFESQFRYGQSLCTCFLKHILVMSTCVTN